MKCPRDSQPLVFVEQGAHMRDRCPTCEGVLLDRDEVMAALGLPGREKALAPERLAAMAPSALKCPRDGSAMRQLLHREVELDLCPECRCVWVDRGELDKIVRGKPKRGKAAGAAAAGALAAGAAVAAAAAAPGKESLVSGLGEAAAEVAVEGAIDLVFEFAVEAIGALFS